MDWPPVVGLEIGTSKVVALVGEMREDGHLMITGMGQRESMGVRKGEIVDLTHVRTLARSVLEQAEENASITLREVNLAVSGGHIQSLVSRGVAPILDRTAGITDEDVDQVMDVARAVNLPPDRDVIHTLCRHFRIDDQESVIDPVGMDGAKLELDMLALHGVRSRIQNVIRAVESIGFEKGEVAFGGLCSALSALTEEQKKAGVLLLDMGGGTTDYVAYCDGVTAEAGSIAVGGEHVTNDIALAFNIPMLRAERLKCEQGSAHIEPAHAARRISLPAEVGFNPRTLSLNALQTVIHARCDELLGLVRARLDRQRLLPLIGACIVLTGGGAHLKGLDKLAEKVFGLPCRIGMPHNVSGVAVVTEGPEYAACIGLIQYAYKCMDREEVGHPIRHWFQELFGR